MKMVRFLTIDGILCPPAAIRLDQTTLTATQATKRQVFDVGSQAEGIYLLRAVAGEESKTIRIIKGQ
ncbi:MAG: hypothetical protein ABS46_09965 [Cytophagaceae bacterium SCN 52-12]|nr:MAG: hypothetical protein ABS46_09965 [Cytophagaceae bacterium SCN 52-12]